MKWTYIICGVVCLCALLTVATLRNMTSSASQYVEIAGHTVAVEIADDEAERAQGLSGRKSLDEGSGLLFIFPSEARYGFWMKDMRFAIDIVWISKEQAVAHIVENVTPETYPSVFEPSQPALYALEVPAGWVASHNIQLGDPVALRFAF